MTSVPFLKMNGLGNEIIVADMRGRADFVLPAAAVALNADPATKFDQIMAIHDPRTPGTANYVQIINSDGSFAQACGNGMRCVVQALASETGRKDFVFETVAGILTAQEHANGLISVDMGIPKFGWQDCADNSGQNYPNSTYGYGRVNALAAVNAALAYQPVSAPEATVPVARVFPNPVADEAIFDLQAPAGAKVLLEIFTADGKRVLSKTWTATSRELVPVPMKGQATGVYFWQINTDSGTASGRLVKE